MNPDSTIIKLLKVLNLLILCVEAFGCIGIFIGYQVVFGHGLGDILYYALLWLATLVHLIWTIRIRNAINAPVILKPLCLFTIFAVLISLKATVWRGPEYSWKNGYLFYRLNPKYHKPTKVNDDTSDIKEEIDPANKNGDE